MAPRLTAGAPVHTPLGKGVVREVRNSGRLLVEVQGRSVVLKDEDVSPRGDSRTSPAGTGRLKRQEARASPKRQREGGRQTSGVTAASEIDLHGLNVEEALARAEQALNDALLADLPELRVIHGRSGGRIRNALHQWLRGISSIKFRQDPRNEGVTIVVL